LWEVPEVSLVFNIMSLKNLFLSTVLFALVGAVQAGEPQVFGDYIVHYNAFNSDTLQPKMAEAYNIVRSKNRGIVTISVMKKDVSPVGKPVRASISLNASNLTGQFRNFKTREINEGNSIYYISEFHVAHEEMLDFTMEVLPEGETQSFTVKFRQKFYTQ
jgi:hypothetical protein